MKSVYKILTNKLLDPPRVLIMKEEKNCYHGDGYWFVLHWTGYKCYVTAV